MVAGWNSYFAFGLIMIIDYRHKHADFHNEFGRNGTTMYELSFIS
jgi:hypothetical protein